MVAASLTDRIVALPGGRTQAVFQVADLFAALPTELPGLLFADTSHPAAQAMLAGADGEPDVGALVPIIRGLTTLAKFMWPIPDRGLVRRLGRITAPTLLVWGERDALVPARYADDFAAGIGDAKTVIVPGAGHLPTVETPAAVITAIGEFLEA